MSEKQNRCPQFVFVGSPNHLIDGGISTSRSLRLVMSMRTEFCNTVYSNNCERTIIIIKVVGVEVLGCFLHALKVSFAIAARYNMNVMNIIARDPPSRQILADRGSCTGTYASFLFLSFSKMFQSFIVRGCIFCVRQQHAIWHVWNTTVCTVRTVVVQLLRFELIVGYTLKSLLCLFPQDPCMPCRRPNSDVSAEVVRPKK